MGKFYPLAVLVLKTLNSPQKIENIGGLEAGYMSSHESRYDVEVGFWKLFVIKTLP